MKPIRVRIPPSPTGLLHIGTVRTALYNHLFAKHYGGVMVYRVEDTDKIRSKKEYEDDITEGLKKLGLAGEEGLHIGGDYGPYRQSERTKVYKKYLQQLVNENKAYYCFCSKERLDEMRKSQGKNKQAPRYDRTCTNINPEKAKERVKNGEKAIIRLHTPDEEDIKWQDGVRGEICIHAKEVDDFVIARSIDDPLYHLTVVADDHDMKISHVIRGEDHISNTPKQILLFRAFEWEEPEFAHLPLILNEDKSKLSKRKNKVSIDDYLNDGYLPEALLNFLVLLGWNTPDEQEIFSMNELIEKFTLDRVHKGGAVFDLKKLDWINGQYLKRKIKENPDEVWIEVSAHLAKWEHNQKNKADKDLVMKILQDPDFEGRFNKLNEVPEVISIFFKPVSNYPLDLIQRERFKITSEILKLVLRKAKSIIESTEWKRGDSSKNEELSKKMINIVSELGLKNGQVLWPLRVALSGSEKSPNFSTLMVYLGKEEVLKRLDFALSKIEG